MKQQFSDIKQQKVLKSDFSEEENKAISSTYFLESLFRQQKIEVKLKQSPATSMNSE